MQSAAYHLISCSWIKSLLDKPGFYQRDGAGTRRWSKVYAAIVAGMGKQHRGTNEKPLLMSRIRQGRIMQWL
jgi:hypothetical protein